MLNDEGRGISNPDIFTSYKSIMSSVYTERGKQDNLDVRSWSGYKAFLIRRHRGDPRISISSRSLDPST